jgi:hypothetical protein
VLVGLVHQVESESLVDAGLFGWCGVAEDEGESAEFVEQRVDVGGAEPVGCVEVGELEGELFAFGAKLGEPGLTMAGSVPVSMGVTRLRVDGIVTGAGERVSGRGRPG